MKIQKAIWDETRHIALGILVLSLLMQAVFYVLGFWDMTVVWGNLLGGIYALLNFFILGLTVQKVANDADEKRGKNLMQFSYSSRMFLTVVIVFLGITLPWFNWFAVLIPQFFTRITIAAMGVTGHHSKQEKKEQEQLAKEHLKAISNTAKVADKLKKKDEAPEEAAPSDEVAAAELAAIEAEAVAAEARAKAARAKAEALKAQQNK